MASCSCKVGSCNVCPSSCKRCGCECDGKTIAEKLNRKRGRQAGVKLKGNGATKRSRTSANAALQKMRARPAQAKESDLSLMDTCTHRPLTSSSACRDDLLTAFGFGINDKKNLPSRQEAAGEKRMSHRTASCTKLVLKRMITTCAKLIAPGHLHTVLQELAQELLSKDSTPLEKAMDSLIEAGVSVVQHAPYGSIQGRVVRAVLTKGLSRKRMIDVANTYEGISTGTAMYERAVADYRLLTTPFSTDGKAQELTKVRPSRQRFKYEVVDEMLKFMLAPRNVGFLSWGKQLVPLGPNEIIELPRLTRKLIATHMFRSYNEFCEEKMISNDDRVSNVPFRKVLNTITCGDQRLLQAEDYVVGRLVNDPCTKLQMLIEFFVCSQEDRGKLTRYLTLSRNFLQVQFDDHVTREDESVATHSLQFALSKDDGCLRNGHCTACEFPFYFLRELRRLITSNERFAEDIRMDALRILLDIEEKFTLYMAHRARVVNAQTAINQILNEMKESCGVEGRPQRGMVVIDWKMKFQPRGSRETTLEHFGKRGIGWHGCLMHTFVNVEEPNQHGENECVVRRKTVYCDQIMCGSNRQDVPAVVAMLESFLWQIKGECPEVEEIVLQSDNASCYQNQMLLMLIPILNCMCKVPIVRFIHTGTQDGKGLIDAHFARGTSQVTTYLQTAQQNKVKKVATPAGLARSLAARGGIQNSFVQLVRVHRPLLEKIQEYCKSLVKDAQKYFSRCDDAFFIRPEGGWKLAGVSEDGLNNGVEAYSFLSSLQEKFKVRLFAYSGIGEGVEFIIDWGAKTFRPLSALAPNSQVGTSMEVNVAPEDDEGQEDEDIPDGEGEVEFVGCNEVDNLDLWDCETVQGYHGIPETQKKFFLTATHVVRCSHLVNVKVGGAERRTENRRERTAIGGDCGRRDMVAYAVRKASEFLEHSEDIRVRDGKDEMEEYNLALNSEARSRKRGWARRVHGNMYGTSYIKDYKQDIAAMFEQGRAEATKQMNSSMMLEALRVKYPGRFTLPGEIEVRAQINSLFSQQKAQERAEKLARERGAEYERKRKQRLSQKYIDVLETLLEENPGLKPLEGLHKLKEHFRLPELHSQSNGRPESSMLDADTADVHCDQLRIILPDDFPADEKVRSKISSIKSMKRAAAQKDIL